MVNTNNLEIYNMAQANESVVLKDVELMWAHFDETDNMSGKYQVDMVNLTPEHIKLVTSLGLEVKTKDNKPEKGSFITARSTKPIMALDAEGNLLKAKVANGSRANTLLSYYTYPRPTGGLGYAPSIKKIKVIDLKQYDPAGDDDFDDDML